MSLDARLREGLQRSMSKLETDAELRLPDAHRRGRRRLLLRRVAVAVLGVDRSAKIQQGLHHFGVPLPGGAMQR